ncbi:MAG: HDIG domain-containing protein [Spirochaetaceae bacterium]|nr:HDIG domain-containing protein [Spirochaetaceae bacterium]
MMNKTSSKQTISEIFSVLSKKLKIDAPGIIILAVTFIILAAMIFFDMSINDPARLIRLPDYEPGKTAPRTIVSRHEVVRNDGAIPAGTAIVRRGYPVSEDEYETLRSLAASGGIDSRRFLGALVYFAVLLILSVLLFSDEIAGKKLRRKETIFLSVNFAVVFLAVLLLSGVADLSSEAVYFMYIPSALAVILTAVLIGHKTSLLFTLILFLGVLYASAFSLRVSLFVLLSGFTVSFIMKKIENRMDMVFASLILALVHIAIMLILAVILPGGFTSPVRELLGSAVNGFITGILALGLLTPLETLMNTATIFRLMDLSDLNSPVMKRMLLTASGTYNHSMMVATLAENACSEIGANPLLARVGAYYHDLGKLEQPEYFVENQREGNKHDEINPRLSAAVIKRHVKGGMEKARQLHMPEEVVNIISEHHGNSLISYFYNEAHKLDDQVTPEEFSYPGSPPASKESAVVMLADTVEAACRTLEKPSVPRLEKFIHELIMAKYEHGQLDQSDLTFKELYIIKNSFVKILAGYYHSRIEYPNQKDPDDDEKQKSAEQKPKSGGSGEIRGRQGRKK